MLKLRQHALDIDELMNQISKNVDPQLPRFQMLTVITFFPLLVARAIKTNTFPAISG